MDTAEGRRITDFVCLFRSTRAAMSNAHFEALSRVVRTMHACPRCEKVYDVGTLEREECDLSMRA
eukprot:11852479-Alexandrium_andersonii.AAC.1